MTDTLTHQQAIPAATATKAPRPSTLTRQGRRSRAGSLLASGWVLGAAVVVVVPLLYLVSISVMTQAQIASGILVPTDPAWQNWADAWNSPLPRGVLNSLIAAFGGAVLSLALAVPGAWTIARHRTGGKTLSGLILSPWLLPPIVAIVPLLTLLRMVGLSNTLTGLTLVYALMNVPVAIWLLDGFIRRIPVDIEESGRIDGANELQLLCRIVVPLLVPALIAVGVIIAILNYNEFLFATFLTQSEESQTVTVLLAGMLSERVQDFGRMAASSLIAVIPIFTIAVLLQRWLVEGLTTGAVK
ncbi:carbohydrate ABC transporter permease [Garicola koreensis]|uniref:Multiple sugar transport system permease protein n=1 Tax=Garicola koreensis TaxID=1262554 RepID=A0A7W5U2S5_9MICC|nr:carbohydrate ABC transporter permease [Garicola koreensis]MBB3668086.1 multiple sugar transport system permease protein [Garicola koreensis]